MYINKCFNVNIILLNLLKYMKLKESYTVRKLSVRVNQVITLARFDIRDK